MARFIPQLEALRGIAALCVVAEHTFIPKWAYRTGIFEEPRNAQEILHWAAHTIFPGRSAVILFLVLSGYVLKLQWDGLSGPPGRKFASYSVRRAFRLLPAFWLSIIFAWALAVVSGYNTDLSALAVFRTLTMQSIDINPPIWSIIAEVQGCLVLPALLFFDRRAGVAGRLGILAALAALHYALNPEPYLRYVIFFYAGVLIHHWGQAVAKRCGPLVVAACLAAIGLAPQIWVIGLPVFTMTDNWAYQIALALPCFVIVSAVAYGRSPLADRILLAPAARFTGKISYSLYLVHYMIAMALWPSYFALVAPYGGLFFIAQIAFFSVVATLSIAVAYVFWKFVEVPFTKRGRDIGNAIAAGGQGLGLWLQNFRRAPQP